MNTAKTVLILGGGWGGLTAAHHLRGLLPSEHRVRVIERNATFSLGVSNMGVMTGDREPHQIRREMAKLKRDGIEWVHADVRGIDPTARTVETDKGTISGDYVVIAVRDYGIGIDEEDLNRIGERFFRAKTSTGIAGTGIGLNVVRALLDLHSGSLDIQSKKGKGSTFTIRLPIAGPAEQTGATEISAA